MPPTRDRRTQSVTTIFSALTPFRSRVKASGMASRPWPAMRGEGEISYRCSARAAGRNPFQMAGPTGVSFGVPPQIVDT